VGTTEETWWLDATAQAELVRDGYAAGSELVEAAVRRAEQLNPALNAIIHPDYDAAVAAASDGPGGPLEGVPFLTKDLVVREAGRPFHEGSRFLKELGYTSDHDQEYTGRVRRAGMVSIGRTNTPEFGMRPACEPAAYGPTHNPWRHGFSPGGSSGGAAAAVAAGIVPMAHANDVGGSIRIPAAFCGVVGLKPSRGRSCLAPDFGDVMLGLAEELVVTRSVRDTAAALDLLSGPGVGDWSAAWPAAPSYRQLVRRPPGRLRIGALDAASVPGSDVAIHPGVAAVVRDTAAVLDDLGHDVTNAVPSALDEPTWPFAGPHYVAGTAWIVDRHWPRILGTPVPDESLEPMTLALAEAGRRISGAELLEARELAQAWTRRLLAWWQTDGYDLLVLPTVAVPTPAHGETDDIAVIATTTPFNVSGQPAMSLPMGEHDGLPVGVQLVADHGREDLLVRLGAQLEAAHPWARRHPPVGG
jgi:amidase